MGVFQIFQDRFFWGPLISTQKGVSKTYIWSRRCSPPKIVFPSRSRVYDWCTSGQGYRWPLLFPQPSFTASRKRRIFLSSNREVWVGETSRAVRAFVSNQTISLFTLSNLNNVAMNYWRGVLDAEGNDDDGDSSGGENRNPNKTSFSFSSTLFSSFILLLFGSGPIGDNDLWYHCI